MTCKTHERHGRVHDANCSYTATKHEGHVDCLHGGHLRHEHNGHYDEHTLSVNEANPDSCRPVDICHGHIHGEGYGHEAVSHGDHIDYIVNGRLHHQRGNHCDDHGPTEIVK